MESKEYMEEDSHSEEVYARYYEEQNVVQAENPDAVFHPENHQQQMEETSNVEMEIAEENLTQNSLLKYQEVETIFRAEYKQIIFTQESDKTTFSILSEQKSDLFKQINDEKRQIEELDIENESLDRRVQLSNLEIRNLHQQVLGNEAIVEKLGEFVKTLKQKSQKNLNRAQDQKKKMGHSENLKSRINQLETDIKNRRDEESHIKNDLQKQENENQLSKLQIAEHKESLSKLVHKYNEENDSKLKDINSLKERRKNLEDSLREKKALLEKYKIDISKSEDEHKININALNKQVEEKKGHLTHLQNQNCNLEDEIDVIKEETENLRNDLDQKLQTWDALKQKLAEQIESSKSKSSQLTLASEKYKELLTNHKYETEPLEEKVRLLEEENENLRKTFEVKLKEYADKLEEKNKAIERKLATDEKANQNRQLMLGIKQLDEKILLKKQKTDLLQAEVQKIIEDNLVQTLMINKAYLMSSQEYLSEKLENLQTVLNSAKNSCEETQNKKGFLESRMEEGSKNLASLKKQLEQPTGILKTALNHKKNSTSPKKVQFVDVSSYESSSLSGEVEKGITLDQIFENLQKSMKPPQAIKKRSLNLD
nr:protein CROWDED NUCLEI 1-like [Leptinotarsa decemlineata]